MSRSCAGIWIERREKMNPRIKRLFTSWRVLLLLSLLLFAVIAIQPSINVKGVTIRTVVYNSSAGIAGIQNPKPSLPPLSRERVLSVNGVAVNTVAEYYASVSLLVPDDIANIVTNKGSYTLTVKSKTKTTSLNETVLQNVTEIYASSESVNGTIVQVNKTRIKTIAVPKTETIVLGPDDLGLKVYESPTTNIRKGLDLQGGTRVLLQPEGSLSTEQMEILLSNMEQRLNVYGLSDISIREADDLSGNQFIIVEIAGANEEEVKDLLAKQGKFEARIGNKTVFTGGDRDITYVCRSSDCSGIDPQAGCGAVEGGYACRFRFSIALKPESAQRQADITNALRVVTHSEQGSLLSKDNQYLNETLDLYLDNQQVDKLNIGADLKGRATTDIAISGSGLGLTEPEAIQTSLANMKRLQTILVTGSLPSKLTIVKTDSLSPVLGEKFINNSLLVGILAIFGVALVIFIRYKKVSISVPVIFFMFSEIVLLLGFAALIGWNLDMSAIAGIIIAIGSGVNHAIIIIDELLAGALGQYQQINWKQKIKNAFFIVFSSYSTVVVAMLPLYYAGAGMLKGFAITTILGLSFGVLVTRPAFAAIVEIFLKE
jgi:preprotein translocase subunit SecD